MEQIASTRIHTELGSLDRPASATALPLSERPIKQDENEKAVVSEINKNQLEEDRSLLAFPENKALSDKPFKITDDQSLNEKFFKWIHKVEGLSTYIALAGNLLGSVFMQLNFSDLFKRKFARLIDILTNLSFIPYGLDGIRIGAEKKNPYQTLGYLLELTTVWLSDLKTKYLIRGAGTGTDQVWFATDQKLNQLKGIVEGRFDNWHDGLFAVPAACWDLLKEFAKDPIGTIFTTNSKGHKALFSSIMDIISTLGFAFTGKEKLFGAVRDFGGMLFDVEMLFKKELISKVGGVLFITESIFDYLAREGAKNEWARLTLNMIAHSAGRAALMCYKNSDPNANKDKEPILPFKSNPDKHIKSTAPNLSLAI